MLDDERNREEGENAMFTKKPLAGFACASCEKKISNLSPNPAQHL